MSRLQKNSRFQTTGCLAGCKRNETTRTASLSGSSYPCRCTRLDPHAVAATRHGPQRLVGEWTMSSPSARGPPASSLPSRAACTAALPVAATCAPASPLRPFCSPPPSACFPAALSWRWAPYPAIETRCADCSGNGVGGRGRRGEGGEVVCVHRGGLVWRGGLRVGRVSDRGGGGWPDGGHSALGLKDATLDGAPTSCGEVGGVGGGGTSVARREDGGG